MMTNQVEADLAIAFSDQSIGKTAQVKQALS
jgi:hypothetical protein